MKKSFVILFAVLLVVPFVGCPDYSHLRKKPDYKNMSDSPEEFGEEEDDPDAYE